MDITLGAGFIMITWLFFMLTHSWLASAWVKGFLTKKIPRLKFAYRLLYNLLAIFFIILLVYFHSKIKADRLIPNGMVIVMFGRVLLLLGIWTVFKAIGAYDLKEFVGLVPLGDSNQGLVTKGLNGQVRHPLYLGSILIMVGIFLTYPRIDVLLSMNLGILYTWIGSKFEEIKLTRVFGIAYTDYKQRTPGFFPRNVTHFFKELF